MDIVLDACEHVVDIFESLQAKATVEDVQRLRDALEDAALAFADRVRERQRKRAAG